MTEEQLKEAREVIAGLSAFGPGLTDHDREVYIAEVIAKFRRLAGRHKMRAEEGNDHN